MDRSLPGSSVHGILQQEYWNGLLCSLPEGLADRGIESASLTSPSLAGGFFTTSATTSKKASKQNANKLVFTPGLFPLITGGKYFLFAVSSKKLGLPWWLSGKEANFQCRRCRLDPWVGKIPWRRKWQPTPVLLPGESHRQWSLVGYSPWGSKRVRHDIATKQLRNYLSQHRNTPYSTNPGEWWFPHP